MSLSDRELWTVIHGLGLGTLFLLAFAGGLAGLWSLRPEWVTAAGLRERLRRLAAGTGIMAAVGWLTVVTGTYVVYPWYRAAPPAGADLGRFPRAYLLADPRLAEWHRFGMEWKEHVSWLSPILATAVAYVVARYGTRLADRPAIRRALLVLFVASFGTAAVGGLFGAFLNKVAPIR